MSATVPKIDVIILAAGLSKRMGGTRKQFQDIGGQRVYQRAIASFASHPHIGQIVLVVPNDHLSALKSYHDGEPLIIVAGGSERHISVACGLAALSASESPYIAIHDAARPNVPRQVIDEGYDKLVSGARAVIPVLAVADTIKQVKSDAPHLIDKTLDRSQLKRVQTPQFFEADLITKLHKKEPSSDTLPTDDASLVEEAGIAVETITGDERLHKLTWLSDLETMKAAIMAYEYRTGTGFDVHRFQPAPSDKADENIIMICGLSVPHDKVLDAHSDGDVGIHALCDAIFGALCDGDIGMHFPPTDERWKDASSDQFLTYAVEKVAKAGGKLIHIDVTILCERPKIGPLRDEMRQKLAELCHLPLSAVSVKATTTERLGFTGRQEGIAAQAAATITLPQQELDR